MALLSVVAVVLSGVAVYFLWKTLQATRQMILDTRRIGERQTKAYLGIGECQIMAGTDPSNISITVTVENSGNSPAIDVEVVVFGQAMNSNHVFADIHGNIPLPNIPAKSERTGGCQISLNQGTPAQYGPFLFSPNFDNLDKVNLHLVAFGYDVFDREIQENAARYSDGRSLGRAGIVGGTILTEGERFLRGEIWKFFQEDANKNRNKKRNEKPSGM